MDFAKYHDFIANKHIRSQSYGFIADESFIPSNLFDWQKEVVKWACEKGRCAIFAGCGMGKTAMQLAWAQQVVMQTNHPVLILAPLAVGSQTVAEGHKFGITAKTIRNMDDVNGICIMNYEMLDHVNPALFGGIVLDESSILKSLTGKIRNQLIQMFQATPYRLCCTATPAPNDYTELGNHSEFLGLMKMAEMLSIWFVNDGFEAGKWRIKGHAKESFWNWIGSWAVCMSKPSDIGNYCNDDFILPELKTIQHKIKVDETDFENGFLVKMSASSAVNLKKDMRKTIDVRVQKAAEIVSTLKSNEQCIIWCELNDESSALSKAIPGAVEITGSMKPDEKSKKMLDFSTGKIRVLVTKPKIAGFGMNWQNCHHMIFVGCSYSFEARYQAIRRCWRFGQSETVYDHVVMAGSESAIFNAVLKKEQSYMDMEKGMVGSFFKNNISTGIAKIAYMPTKDMELPLFLRSA